MGQPLLSQSRIARLRCPIPSRTDGTLHGMACMGCMARGCLALSGRASIHLVEPCRPWGLRAFRGIFGRALVPGQTFHQILGGTRFVSSCQLSGRSRSVSVLSIFRRTAALPSLRFVVSSPWQSEKALLELHGVLRFAQAICCWAVIPQKPGCLLRSSSTYGSRDFACVSQV